MTYGQFKKVVNDTYPGGNNRFSIGGGILLKMKSWGDEELDALEIDGYTEEYDYKNEERWFFVTAKKD